MLGAWRRGAGRTDFHRSTGRTSRMGVRDRTAREFGAPRRYGIMPNSRTYARWQVCRVGRSRPRTRAEARDHQPRPDLRRHEPHVTPDATAGSHEPRVRYLGQRRLNLRAQVGRRATPVRATISCHAALREPGAATAHVTIIAASLVTGRVQIPTPRAFAETAAADTAARNSAASASVVPGNTLVSAADGAPVGVERGAFTWVSVQRAEEATPALVVAPVIGHGPAWKTTGVSGNAGAVTAFFRDWGAARVSTRDPIQIPRAAGLRLLVLLLLAFALLLRVRASQPEQRRKTTNSSAQGDTTCARERQ